MTPRTDTPSDSRRRGADAGGWTTTHLPLALVMLALVALVALPVLAGRRVQPLNAELRDVIEPARGLVTEIHVQLAIEGSAFHDYVDSRRPELLQRYQQAYARELATYAHLSRLASQLGPDVQRRFEKVNALERRWHDMVAQLLAGGEREMRAAAVSEEDLFEALLLATSELDEALTTATRDRRQRITEAERGQRRFATVIALVALGAMVGVAWLAQRARVYAREAEEQRIALERAQESRARLIRGVSHDLKNPLGAIDGHAALLEEGIKGPLNADQRESIARIRRSVRALLGLITDLLDLSKAEAGHLTISRQPINVADVVREAAEEHRDAARAAGHELRAEIDTDLPVIETDPDRVRQVLGNLLSNAVKYTPSGGQVVVRLEERLRPDGRAGPRRYAAIDVVDNGPGIPRDKLDEIFEEFSRLESGTTPGTGLGLTIARRISRLLGGDISAASDVGRGATFTLWLPIDPPGQRRAAADRRQH